MAPTRTVRNKLAAGKSDKGKTPKKPSTAPSGVRKSKPSKAPKLPPPKQQKTKPGSGSPKKKRRVYTEKELGLPKLNTITPVGVDPSKGKKRGKVFIDDQESMMTILAIVNASKEGQIESKMMKSRQMEEIRDARRKEAEARQEQRNSKLEETKDALRSRKKRKLEHIKPTETPKVRDGPGKKRVAFA
ncbi:MAG: hypothetical protein LQ346_000622 [Caloplaca aetnensis]|nr:MAG: hypothetical protein LQ346_000622 [Caloplaca aetnensis]